MSETRLKAIYARKSTRKYNNKKPPKEKIEKIIKAGMWAPSPKNIQPWRFLVVDDKTKIETIAKILERRIRYLSEESAAKGVMRKDLILAQETVKIIKQLPVLIFIFLTSDSYRIHDDGVNWELNERDIEVTHIMSIGAAIQNMLLEATDEQIDSLWMGDFFYAYNEIKEYLGKKGTLLAVVGFGYGINDKSERSTRRKFQEVVEYI
mgnify:FL=1